MNKSCKGEQKESTALNNNKIKSKFQKIFSTCNVIDILPVNKWWDREKEVNFEKHDEIKWEHLEHNGVLFPPKYEKHNIRIEYQGTPIELNEIQEEYATYWAQLMDSELYSKKITRKNFFKEFKSVLGDKYKDSSLDDFNFKPIYNHLIAERERRKSRTVEEKKLEKESKSHLLEKYGYALVDGINEKISNYMVEPPGIFRGRGEHPLSGRIKPRIVPEHVTINVGLDDPVPKCQLEGHCWKDIVHNNEATWLAFYKDENSDKSSKYVFLAANSKFKGKNDFKKYEKARKLKGMITTIRNDYYKKLVSKEMEDMQLGVATYLIDVLALRVGNEKNDDEADTVGCCSLRVEHVKLEEGNKLTLDFLGKDSMRYFNTVELDENVHKCIGKFLKGKKPEDDLFDLINVISFIINRLRLRN